MSRLIKFGKVAAVLYLLALLIIFMMQRQFMYFPPASHPGLSSTGLTEMVDVKIANVDGSELSSWWHPPEPGQAVVIFFHGNGSSIYGGRFIYQHLIAEDFGVLAAEYPGYPGSQGSPTERSLIAAAEAHYDFVTKQGVSPDQIYLYGTSLGAGVSVQLAARKPVGKIVIEAPFNSMLDMTRIRMPLFAYWPVVKDKYRSDQALKNLDVPILWVHGTSDRVIPIAQGQKLFDGYDGPKEQMIIGNGSHVNLWVSGGRERITDFLKQ